MSEIQCLAVSEQHQGKGIGSALVQACLELAKQKGIVEVMAISSSDAFLQKLGFEYSLPEQKRALFYQLRSRADVFKSRRIEPFHATTKFHSVLDSPMFSANGLPTLANCKLRWSESFLPKMHHSPIIKRMWLCHCRNWWASLHKRSLKKS